MCGIILPDLLAVFEDLCAAFEDCMLGSLSDQTVAAVTGRSEYARGLNIETAP